MNDGDVPDDIGLDDESLPEREHGYPFEVITRHTIRESFAERTLPHSKDAEVALLSAILRNNVALEDSVVAVLKPEEFYRDAHGRIFKAMRTLRERSIAIEFTTLAIELEKHGDLDEVGGRIYLRAILEWPKAQEVATYAKIIRDKANTRNLIFLLNESLVRVYEAEGSVYELYGQAFQKLFQFGRELADQ